MKTKQTIHRMSEQDHRKLKAFCASKGVTLQEFITKAIEEYQKKWTI